MIELLALAWVLAAAGGPDRRTEEEKRRDRRRAAIRNFFLVALVATLVSGCVYGCKCAFDARDQNMYNLGVKEAQENLLKDKEVKNEQVRDSDPTKR